MLSSDNPAHVTELGSGDISFDEHYKQITHLFGEMIRLSSSGLTVEWACDD